MNAQNKTRACVSFTTRIMVFIKIIEIMQWKNITGPSIGSNMINLQWVRCEIFLYIYVILLRFVYVQKPMSIIL